MLKKLKDRHFSLIEQIKAFELVIPPSNIEAMRVLEHFRQQVESIIADMAEIEHESATSNEHPLSPREVEVIALIAMGQPNKEIAYKLSISPKTVQFHIKSIFTKLEVGSRTEAATKALSLKIISL